MARENYSFLLRQQRPVQIRRITDWNEAEFSEFLMRRGKYSRGNAVDAAFGAYLYDEPVGAAEMTLEEGYIDLLSVEVQEEMRRSGIGTALLDRAKEFAAEMDVDQISADFVNDTEDGAAEAFFLSNGFYLSESGNAMLTLRPADLLSIETLRRRAEKALPKNVAPLDQLILKLRGIRSQSEDASIPGDLLPWNTEGRLLGDLSMGCVDENGQGAFLLFAEWAGEVCLVSVYTDEAHVTLLLNLFAHALAAAADRGIRELKVAIKNPAFGKMFGKMLEKVTEEKPEFIQKQTLQRMVWELEDEKMEQEAAEEALAGDAAAGVEEGLEILIPKLMQLMDILEEEEVDCDLALSEIPYLLIDNRIVVQYYPMDDAFERFTLMFSCRLVPEEAAQADGGLTEMCTRINEICQFVAAIPGDGDLLLRYAVSESYEPLSDRQLLASLDAFRREMLVAEQFANTERM